MLDKYAVMGNPIEHSKSPMIHAMFASQTGEALHYEALLVDLEAFEASVEDFCRNGGKGLNITVPFKQQAWQWVTERTSRAEKAGAVNTIIIRDGESVTGDNTDGYGLVRDLTVNQKVELAGKRVLVLGAGGAVRGVLGPLLAEGVASVVVANRTSEKAIALADLFADEGNIMGCGFDSEQLDKHFDVVINGTSASLHGDVPPVPSVVVSQAVCYDMMYGKTQTPFLKWCEANQAAKCIDGLGMLIEQAAESFFQWRGIRPDTGPVFKAMR